MAIDGQQFSGHLFAPLLTPFAMQIYSLITVSLIWISHFDSNVDVTILYSCPHICLPPPPTQADAEAVRESMRAAFARGTTKQSLRRGAGLLASLPAHAASPHCPRMRMPRGPRMGASLASPAHSASPARHHFCPPARDLPPLVRTSRRPCAGPAARARTPCHRQIATPGPCLPPARAVFEVYIRV